MVDLFEEEEELEINPDGWIKDPESQKPATKGVRRRLDDLLEEKRLRDELEDFLD